MRPAAGKIVKAYRSTRGRLLAAVRRAPIRGAVAPERLSGGDPVAAREAVRRNLAALAPPSSGDAARRWDAMRPASFVEAVVREADAVLRHEVRLFGRAHPLDDPIDWHRDYVSGFRWPAVFYRDARIIDLSDGSDVRFPWEVSRFHHAVTLGMAYRFTRDERYAAEFVSQLDSWIDANPPNRGIHWNCAMEVAVRAVNLLWACAFLRDSPALDARRHDAILHLLHAHGERIYSDPENVGVRPGNHYLANLAGLAYIACLAPVFDRSERWRSFAVRELGKEMESQVHPDGTDFEGSIPYHGLATEILFHAAYVLGRFGSPGQAPPSDAAGIREAAREQLGDAYMARLEKMFAYILSCTRPDGTYPRIGDGDDGRLLRLGKPGEGEGSHRHLLALGGELFDRDDFRAAAGEARVEAAWLFPGARGAPAGEASPPASAAFPDGGVYVLRDHGDHLAIRCGPLGHAGKGTHNHNDNLGFELCCGGVPYLVDPGTYNYSRDPGERNLFRSVRSHNTVCVDGLEQNGFDDRDMFALRKGSEARALSWESDGGRDRFSGEVRYAGRDGKPVTHVREVEFDKGAGCWTLRDEILGGGEAVLSWSFILAPGVVPQVLGDGVLLRRGGDALGLALAFEGFEGHAVSIGKSHYSPAYDSRIETAAVRIVRRGRLPARTRIRIRPWAASDGEEGRHA